MLFDPTIVVRDPLAVVAIVLVIVFGKSLAAFAIVLIFGYPVTTALIISASLAQIGEFSFILAGLGVVFGVFPSEGRDLVIAGALLSIILNPLAFAAVDPLAHWLRGRPWLLSWLERPQNRLATNPRFGTGESPQGHAIIVGYGRVGGQIGEALRALELQFVVIEENRRRVEELRKRGIAAVYGDATAAGVLDAAGVNHARLLIIAAPRGFQTQRILDIARQANPGIDTAVRAHSIAELGLLERQNVGIAIMGERELALGLADYAFRSLGLSEERAYSVVRTMRQAGKGGAFDRRRALDPSGAPELQLHRDEKDTTDTP
jgi:CPA2 family monovalent cation:H+ antiporter-2